MSIYYTDSGNTIHLGSQIGRGGEGIIYLIQGYPSDVAKIYIKPQSAEVHRKILVMVQNPPHDPTVNGPTKHRSIAWPSDILYSDRQKKQFAGFLMPRIDMKIFKKILNYISPDDRLKSFTGGFTWLHLYTTARNLASCVGAIHECGYCIGDLNESNVLAQPTTPLTVIDCDSFQVQDQSSGKKWRCTVGKPEYTAPELLGKKYEDIDRTYETDCFALAIMIFQLLMEGFHPYQATGSLVANSPLTHDKIRQGIFAYATSMKGIAPPPDAPSFDILHPEIRSLFLRCFDAGHKDPSLRPSAKEWMAVLKKLSQNFRKCSTNDNHLYLDHLNSCPWCIRAKKTGKDTFPSPVGQQIKILDPNNQVISKQEREAYLLTFIEMALADGYLSHEEETYIIDQGLKLHIPEKDTKKLIANEIQKKGLLPISRLNPVLNINKNYIDFNDVKNGTTVYETIEISNSGDGVLTGTLSASVAWVKVPSAIAPNSKNQFQKIDIAIDTTGLPYGFSGTGNVLINTNGGNKTITINLKTEGLQLLLPQFRSRYVPLVASLCGFIGSFTKSPAEGFFTAAIGYGLLTYLLSKFILKFTLNRGIDLCNFPRGVIHGISSVLIFLTIFSHSNTQSLMKGYAPVPTPAPALVEAPAPAPAPTPAPEIKPETSSINITKAVVASGLDENQTPKGVDTSFYAGQQRLYYYISYHGGIPDTTELIVKLYIDGNYKGQFQRTLKYASGNLWHYFDHNFQPGEYNFQLHANGKLLVSTFFRVVPRNADDQRVEEQKRQREADQQRRDAEYRQRQLEEQQRVEAQRRQRQVELQQRDATSNSANTQRRSFEPPSQSLRSDGWKKSRESATYEDE